MKKTITIMLIALIAIIGSVFAYQGYGMNSQNSNYERGTYHESVEKILETGSYQDLINLREEIGFNVMRKVQSEEDFKLMQERHEYNQANGIEPGYLRNNEQRGSDMSQRFGKGQGMRNNGNCPYSN